MTQVRRKKFKLKISEFTMEPPDKELVVRNIKHLAELRQLSKRAKDPTLKDIFQKEMHSIRGDLLKNYAQKFFKVSIALGPHVKEEFYPYYPEIDTIQHLKNNLVESLSKKRENNKQVSTVRREFNGMRYEMLGKDDGSTRTNEPTGRYNIVPVGFAGIEVKDEVKKKEVKILPGLKGGGRVFKEPGSIVGLISSDEYARRIGRAKRPYDKSKYVGVEIELICALDRDQLNNKFVQAKLAGLVYVKHDGSIRPENNNEHTHEVTIIGKQENINEVVRRVCEVLNSADVGAYVNNTCGLHVHLDMRSRDYKKCYMNLYKIQPILMKMVPRNRTQGNQYCVPNKHATIEDMERMDRTARRRQAINPVAYEDHNTLEVRLHSGSMNAIKINNWINILLAAIDKDNVEVAQVETAEDMQKHFGISNYLVEYINRRINKFKDDVSTKADHYDNVV